MKLYKRIIEDQINNFFKKSRKKILFVWGPRRSGKTTVITKIAKKKKARLFNFDYLSEREYFVNDKEALARLVEENPIILIDEVQNFPESTVVLKILADNFPVKIVATGSSELRKKSQKFDSLTGRYDEIFCLPLSLEEFIWQDKPKALERQQYFRGLMKKLMTYGCYPEINTLLTAKSKIETLQKLFDAYVLKDIVDIYDLKSAKLAKDILLKIALQVGQEVSINEIANSLRANTATVANYIEIFEKNYILLALPSFKTNIRRAVSENKKYYFYDLGIRNVLIKDFRSLELRQDKGSVFENLVIAEMLKKIRNRKILKNLYFYREYGGREVDLVVEDYFKKYQCFEIKLKEEKLIKKIFPLKHQLAIITSQNYFRYLEPSNAF